MPAGVEVQGPRRSLDQTGFHWGRISWDEQFFVNHASLGHFGEFAIWRSWEPCTQRL